MLSTVIRFHTVAIGSSSLVFICCVLHRKTSLSEGYFQYKL